MKIQRGISPAAPEDSAAPAPGTTLVSAPRAASGEVSSFRQGEAPLPSPNLPAPAGLPSLSLGTASALKPEDKPHNQPSARFVGKTPAIARPPDARPTWMGSELHKRGVVLGPNVDVPWMAKAVFNPSAVVKDGKLFLVFRGQDLTGAGKWFGTSRIGLAESTDGVHFKVHAEPVLVPDQWYEEEGGAEDPRVTQIDGRYFMTYTGYRYADRTARLCLAVSDDLVHWSKHGPMMPDIHTEGNAPGWSKSGAILPQKVGGEYLMYFGDTSIYLARSKDGLHWTPDAEPVLHARPGFFDGNMVEPGPAPWLDANGDIHLLYNGDAPPPVGSDEPGGYAAGEVVFSGKNPRETISRSQTPILKVTEPDEMEGQVGNVIFLEGFVRFQDKLQFYYGGADTKIFHADSDAGS